MACHAPSTDAEELVLGLSPEGGLLVDTVCPPTDPPTDLPAPPPLPSTSLFGALREMCPQSSTLVAAMDVCDAQATQYLHACSTESGSSSSSSPGLTWDDAMALLVCGRCLADAALAAGLCAGRGARFLARVAQAAAKLPRVRGTYYRGLGARGVPHAGCRVRWPHAVPVVADYMAAHAAYRARPFAQLLVLDGAAARCLPPALAAAVPVPFALLDPGTVLVATEVAPRLQLATLAVPGPGTDAAPLAPPPPKRPRAAPPQSLFAPSTSVFQAAAGPEAGAPEAPQAQGSAPAPAFLPLGPASPEVEEEEEGAACPVPEQEEEEEEKEEQQEEQQEGQLPLAHEELLLTGKSVRALAAQLGVSVATATRAVEASFRGHALTPRSSGSAPDVFTFPLQVPGHAPVRGVVQRARQASWAFNTLVDAPAAPRAPFCGPHPASAAAVVLPAALGRRLAHRLGVAPEAARARVHAAYARACARGEVCACPGAYLDFPLDAARGLRLTLSPPHTLWQFLGTE